MFTPFPSATDGDAASRRAAIIGADGNGQDHTIVFQPGVYRLAMPDTAGQENDREPSEPRRGRR
jgi:hypothetical protein